MVLTITHEQFAAAINDTYYAILDKPTNGLNAVDLRTLVMHILNTNTQISKPDLDDNMTDFHSGINSGLPLAIYTRKQEKRQVFAADAGVPISDKTMITTGTKHALACGNMTLAWREWKCYPVIDHTWTRKCTSQQPITQSTPSTLTSRPCQQSPFSRRPVRCRLQGIFPQNRLQSHLQWENHLARVA
jgi:hypothetical protein